MATSMGLIPNPFEFETLQEMYGLSPTDGVEFSGSGVMIASPPSGKICIYLNKIDVATNIHSPLAMEVTTLILTARLRRISCGGGYGLNRSYSVRSTTDAIIFSDIISQNCFPTIKTMPTS
ncbi:unnamed protein product [Lactuca saligna]|uniref:Uncharacterized protein n=1 Tax=Lactuca saligna TaxID=75948 RepID=A0AA35ZZX8_LACSI|nr:unnamed protein product [Lactuca saligna]